MSNDFSLAGTDLFGNQINPKPDCRLAANFIVPPFSVLNARAGAWQDRKRQWISLGIKSEIGRGEILHETGSSFAESQRRIDKFRNMGGRDPGRSNGQDLMRGEHVVGSHLGRRPHGGSLDERAGREPGTEYAGGDAWVASQTGSGTSIFDPVLTELAYRWFCPAAGQIIDPFSGGSVRGIVASLLGYRYWGCDLRPEQIAANRQQASGICPENAPQWAVGDAMDLLGIEAPTADFIFSCPPYGDLERYSDDPRDLSTMDYHAFIGAYRRIILRCAERLKHNRFACFVVGDFRDPKTGNCRNFVGDTVESFRQCGLALYNEAILITCVGSLPIRVGKQFISGRKLGKTHQNMLVFVKGDGKLATVACGQIDPEYDWM